MHGEVVFDHFQGKTYEDVEVKKLLKKIVARPHDYQPKGMYEHFQGEVVVTTTDGKRYSARVDQPLRGPKNATPPDRLEQKFNDCALRALTPSKIMNVYEALNRFESLANVCEMTKLIADSSLLKQ